MKRSILIAIAIMFTGLALAQVTVTNDTVTKSEVLELIKSANVILPEAKEALTWGNQIAIAIKGCVSALNDGVTATSEQLYKFSESKLGKITIAILVYKIIGKEILATIISLVLMFVLTKMFIKFMKYLFEKTEDYDSRFSDMNSSPGDAGTFIFAATGIVYVILMGILLLIAL